MAKIYTIPNIITFIRIVLIPIILYLLFSENPNIVLLAGGLFIISSISDYFDGYLARKYSAVSQLGEILDPIADKILILFVLFGLAINLSSYLIGFITALIITREIWVGALRDMNARNGKSDVTKVTLVTSLLLFLAFISLSAPTQISLAIITAPMKPIK